jgi:hypothetical protein
MKKVSIVLAAGLLSAALIAPGHAGPSSRTVTRNYSMANGMFVSQLGNAEVHWSLGTQWKVFRTKAGEHLLSLSVKDDTGRPVLVNLSIDADSDGKEEDEFNVCSDRLQNIKVRPGAEVWVGVLFGTCEDGSPSIVTNGTITATFSR